mmetsp:Transcript_7112/g.8998  ORF Transcript_7112/g.8998 Transcript_7112/m.8998 type:complete len:96 (+) Transcript_7112:73-360(+)
MSNFSSEIPWNLHTNTANYVSNEDMYNQVDAVDKLHKQVAAVVDRPHKRVCAAEDKFHKRVAAVEDIRMIVVADTRIPFDDDVAAADVDALHSLV